ncbi:acid phosphatase [Edaphobacter modestus]|uniref:acid phosphatase n=1 Tax=Edaphobacter modestus TaxID=388466 RepID=UPI0013EEAA6C|nr:phosphatase PAP2 family protein [Edaphobacter modestus]
MVVQSQSEKPTAATPKPAKTAYYVDSALLDVGVFLPEPPAVDSALTKAELAELHRIERVRTPEPMAKALADEGEENMFVFKTVFGPGFTAEALPVTAALGVHVKNEQSVVGNQLKHSYQRPRPYQTDTTLHPVCALKTEHDSYPSGHGMTGYLEAFTLAEIVPDKRTEILARADDYALNRLVCGVHYPSDIEASRRVAYVVFGYMLATPRFQRDLAAAREEIRAKLGLARNKN